MRFEALSLARFGHFAALDVAMPADRGLVVLFGPNEAGKTTLLDALRGALYGIEKSAYAFKFGGDAMEVRARLVDRDGRAVDLVRKRAKKARLAATRAGEPLAEDVFAGYFGEIARAQFETVFGFTRKDLEEGAELFKTAGFADILAGSALGGAARVRELREELERESAALFSPRARNPKVNDALSRLAALEKARDAAMLSGAELRRIVAATDDESKRAAAIEDRLAALEKDRARVARRLNALADVQELRAIDLQLASADLASPLDGAAAEALARALDDADAVRRKAADLARDIEAIRARAEGRVVDEALLAHADRVRVLVKRVDRVAHARARLPLDAQQIAAMRDALDADRARHTDGMTLEAVAAWRPSASAREAVERLADASLKLEGDIDAATKARAKDAETAADARREWQAAGGDAPTKDVRAQAEALQKLQHDFAEHENQRASVRKIEAEVARMIAQMAPKPPANEELDAVALPSRDAVQEHKKELEKLRKKAEAAEEKRREIDAKLAERTARRDALRVAGQVPTMADLEAARARRDEGWKLVKRAWVDGKDVKKEARAYDADHPLHDAFERAMAAADKQADRIREEAQRVAQLLEIDVEIATETAALAAATAEHDAVSKALEEWRAGWLALWNASGVEPRDPGEMLDWLKHAADAREKLAQVRKLEIEMMQRQEVLDAFAKRAREELGLADAAVDVVLATMRERIEDERDRAVRREDAKRRLDKHEAAVAAADVRLAELRAKHDEAREALAKALPEVSLAADLEPAVARRRLEALDRLVAGARALADREREHAANEREVGDFDREVAELCGALGRTLDGRTPEQAVAWLDEQLRDADKASDLRRQDREEAERKAAQAESAAREVAVVEQTIERLRPKDVANDEATLRAACARALARAEKQKMRGEIDLRLARQLGNGEVRRADEEALAKAEPGALEAEQERLAHAIEQARREAGDARERLGALRKEQEQLGGDAAAKAQADIERERARLVEESERYCVLEVARAVLERVVERFTREHQPALLMRASALLSTITGGRYVDIVRPLGDDEIAVVSKTREKKRPGELSTGTREQLFLALRLAYVVEYCARAEPLPIVADDVLANFDADRTARALSALADVAKHTQVLLLTCHEHVVARTRASGIDAHVIELPEPA